MFVGDGLDQFAKRQLEMTGQTGEGESVKRLEFSSVDDGKLQGCKGIGQRSWLKSFDLKIHIYLFIVRVRAQERKREMERILWHFCRSQFSPSICGLLGLNSIIRLGRRSPYLLNHLLGPVLNS